MPIFFIYVSYYDAENIAFFLKLHEDYFNTELNLENRTPTAISTLRIYSLINPEGFMKIFANWGRKHYKRKK